jgi:hypothetical protein
MISFHEYIKEELINSVDPYGEESWEYDDEKTKIIKSKLKELADKYNFKYSHERPAYENILQRLTNGNKGEEKIYEVREYEDGGPNDKGYRVGWVKARNKHEARSIWAIKKKNLSIICTGGFLYFMEYSTEEIEKKTRELRKRLNDLENMPSINTI